MKYLLRLETRMSLILKRSYAASVKNIGQLYIANRKKCIFVMIVEEIIIFNLIRPSPKPKLYTNFKK